MNGNDINESDFERQLRESLRRDAERISPRDRRTEIMAMAHDDARLSEPRRRWLIPASAAASVALIGGIAWGVSNSGDGLGSTPAATSSSTQAPSSSVKVPVPSPSSSATGATTQVALPAYFVGANSGAGDRFGLYREFVSTAVPVEATPAQKAEAAVRVAMNAQPFTNLEPYIQPWSGTSVQEVTVTPSLITMTLNGSGASGFTQDQTKLAVQELVWTAQGAIGKGTIPVKFVVAGGGATLFGTYPTAQTYNRPAKDLQYQDLAPIWITFPERDHVFKAGKPVVATGESCAFEATTQWQLKRGGAEISTGTTTATSGCPIRGTWKVDLGGLLAGDYTFRMYEVSMQDGTGVIAETSKSFTVR